MIIMMMMMMMMMMMTTTTSFTGMFVENYGVRIRIILINYTPLDGFISNPDMSNSKGESIMNRKDEKKYLSTLTGKLAKTMSISRRIVDIRFECDPRFLLHGSQKRHDLIQLDVSYTLFGGTRLCR